MKEAIKKLIKQMNCNKNVLLIFIANTLAYLIVIQEELLGTINMGDYTPLLSSSVTSQRINNPY
jgi:hypothetical protein